MFGDIDPVSFAISAQKRDCSLCLRAGGWIIGSLEILLSTNLWGVGRADLSVRRVLKLEGVWGQERRLHIFVTCCFGDYL